MLPELVRRGGAAGLADAEREMHDAKRMGAVFVGIGEPDYPSAAVRQSSTIVAIKGNPEVFRLPPIAIAGARNASMAGIKFARTIARELGEAGYAILSGLHAK
jgi:DNA processing protein